ncbi:helix-turn-helix domain-containing protein [Sphingorhabdus sp.]|uniref:helix-turn-helix domain-containing protein n=1 Tax=Sphingorhabdus sp. TaxID=1902408 RepID=UPI0035B1D784
MKDRDQDNSETEATAPETGSVGSQLYAAREAAGLSLTEIATRTRVPIRHLEAIEASNYSALPGSTYTIGFTRSYAKALGLDETALLTELRQELAEGGYQNVARTPEYEPADPARVPSRPLAWGAAALAIALIIVYFIWRSFALAPVAEGDAAKPVAEAPIKDQSGPAKAETQIDPSGQVVITARETVWLKIYDTENNRLYENEMKAGESFTVPKDANNPMIVTGRPQVLDVTIGGKPVPPLGTGERSIADVGISATALLARKTEAAPVQNAAGASAGPAAESATQQ